MWVAIILLVVAIILVAAMPKPPSTEARTATAPEVRDGRKIRRAYGTVWIDDPTIIGWKPMGTIPIKSEGK